LGSNGFIWVEVTSLKALAVDLVDLIELQSWFGVVCRKRPDRLRGQSPTVDQKENASRYTRLHKAVDLIDHHEGLACARSHRHEHPSFAFADSGLDGGIRLTLILA
jgi:hypothetical protein